MRRLPLRGEAQNYQLVVEASSLPSCRSNREEQAGCLHHKGYGSLAPAVVAEVGRGLVRAEVAEGRKHGTLPPYIGIRIKPFNEELRARSFRTLEIFVTKVVEQNGGQLPDNFVVTLPKITIPEQVVALVTLLSGLEKWNGLAEGSLKFEMMIETTQSIINHH